MNSNKQNYNTNLSAEFYVLSMLFRQGFNATLTLGNKKSVDIFVALRSGKTITIDVKGLSGKTSWPVDNLKRSKKGHFIVFVCFKDDIENPELVPDVFIIPSKNVRKYTYNAPGGRKVVQYLK